MDWLEGHKYIKSTQKKLKSELISVKIQTACVCTDF
jgi:hypothetical protein